MKGSNTLAGNATIKQHLKEILLNTKGQCMKESNTLAGNATIKQLQREVFIDTKGYFMRESNSPECIAARNLLIGHMSQGTKENNIL